MCIRDSALPGRGVDPGCPSLPPDASGVDPLPKGMDYHPYRVFGGCLSAQCAKLGANKQPTMLSQAGISCSLVIMHLQPASAGFVAERRDFVRGRIWMVWRCR